MYVNGTSTLVSRTCRNHSAVGDACPRQVTGRMNPYTFSMNPNVGFVNSYVELMNSYKVAVSDRQIGLVILAFTANSGQPTESPRSIG